MTDIAERARKAAELQGILYGEGAGALMGALADEIERLRGELAASEAKRFVEKLEVEAARTMSREASATREVLTEFSPHTPRQGSLSAMTRDVLDHISRDSARLRRLTKVATSCTAESWLELSDEVKTFTFALAIEEGDRRKALEKEVDRLEDKVDGLYADLDSALDVMWRRGDDGARDWIRMNYSSWALKMGLIGD